MKTSRTIRAASSDRQRSEQVRLLGDALRDGGLVVLPTETVYGVAASAVDPRARLRLDRLVEAAGGEIASSHASRHTLHAPDADRLVQDLDITHPIHRRLFRRLAPGPVRFAVEKQAQDLIACLDRLGVGEGIIDEGRFVYARVPNHELCREVLRAAEVPVVIRRLSVFGWGSGRDIGAVSDDEVAEQSGLAWVLDDGVTSLGGHSTTVQLRLAGGFAVEPGGALSEEDVTRQVERSILFLCTGNTCRSPMAEAVALSILAESPALSVTTRVQSAGVAATPGQEPTPEAVRALVESGIRGRAGQPPLAGFRSRPLTRSMIEQADVVYTMTRGHAQSVVAAHPSAAERIMVLDPGGTDVPDPIGGSLELYRQTARRLAELIRRRISELDR